MGFDVREDGSIPLQNACLKVGASQPGSIGSWVLEGSAVPDAIDGLSTSPGSRAPLEVEHPNGALAVDHLVVLTPSLERTTAAFEAAGVECRRVRDAGGGVRQGFFLIGDLLVEAVEGAGHVEPDDPARFWGLTIVVDDIDAASRLLGDRLGRVKDAVQPGRRIATVRAEASGGLPLAFITPRGSPENP
jgi:hypothetical protein